MRVVYFSVIRDVLCESVEFEWPVDYVILWVQYRCSEYQESKEIRMKRKRKSFVKKFNWFLLISGSSLILAWRSWLLIYVSSLGHDKHGIKYIYIYIYTRIPLFQLNFYVVQKYHWTLYLIKTKFENNLVKICVKLHVKCLQNRILSY